LPIRKKKLLAWESCESETRKKGFFESGNEEPVFPEKKCSCVPVFLI
jgi:hypothetical protein